MSWAAVVLGLGAGEPPVGTHQEMSLGFLTEQSMASTCDGVNTHGERDGSFYSSAVHGQHLEQAMGSIYIHTRRDTLREPGQSGTQDKQSINAATR